MNVHPDHANADPRLAFGKFHKADGFYEHFKKLKPGSKLYVEIGTSAGDYRKRLVPALRRRI